MRQPKWMMRHLTLEDEATDFWIRQTSRVDDVEPKVDDALADFWMRQSQKWMQNLARAGRLQFLL